MNWSLNTYSNKLLSKAALVAAVFLMSAAVTAPVEARGYKDGGRHYGGHGYRGHGYRSHRRHRSHRSRRGAYLAGGLVLGSLLTHAYHRRHHDHRDPYVVRETRVVRTSPQATSGRRLFRDRDGNCFERTVNHSGDELLIELDRNECAW